MNIFLKFSVSWIIRYFTNKTKKAQKPGLIIIQLERLKNQTSQEMVRKHFRPKGNQMAYITDSSWIFTLSRGT